MAGNNNGSFKQKKVYFSKVSNSALRDPTLSLKAKGLYSLIQSYITIENFILYKNTLKKSCIEKDLAFQGAWDELKKAGYLIQTRYQNSDGKFIYEYDLLDISEKETLVNQHVTSINHTPKNHCMDNPPYGEPGVYNKTDINSNAKKEKEPKMKYHRRKKNGGFSNYQLQATADMARIELHNASKDIVNS